MQSPEPEKPFAGTAEQVRAFCARILLNSVFHAMRKPMDALHVHRFQTVGLLSGLEPPDLPDDIVKLLLDPNHPRRLPFPDGPLVFIRNGERAVIAAEVSPLLLNAKKETRGAAMQYFERTGTSRDPILTPRTIELLANRSSEIHADDVARWRAAGIELVTALRDDLFGHIAGLKQCMAADYQEGFDEYVQRVMRPSFNSLAYLRPPVWSATEQRSEIEGWIDEFAKLPTLTAALTGYYDRCGYLPLCGELDAGEVARRWSEQHPVSEISWKEISAWAATCETPLGKYHAVTVALSLRAARPADSVRELWDEVFAILDTVGEVGPEQSRHAIWLLYCELASHFARHVEALHPGQDGERIACYAWWLTEKIGRIFGETGDQATRALAGIIKPEQTLSFSRWSIARSPVAPSSFRYATLFSRSVWALSLIVQFDRVAKSFNLTEIPEICRERIASIAGGYLVTCPMTAAAGAREPALAIDQRSHLPNLLMEGGVLRPEERDELIGVSQVRLAMADMDGLKSRLRRLADERDGDQQMTLYLLKAITFSSTRYDDVIADWLNDTTGVIEALQWLPESDLVSMIEALGEFQQHPRADWPIRLPHVLAYAIEKTDELDRFEILQIHTVLMSINGGIVSPIQRIMSSNWRAESLTRLRIWRENIAEAAKYSEPWVAARVRATSATISRLVGPRG